MSNVTAALVEVTVTCRGSICRSSRCPNQSRQIPPQPLVRRVGGRPGHLTFSATSSLLPQKSHPAVKRAQTACTWVIDGQIPNLSDRTVGLLWPVGDEPVASSFHMPWWPWHGCHITGPSERQTHDDLSVSLMGREVNLHRCRFSVETLWVALFAPVGREPQSVNCLSWKVLVTSSPGGVVLQLSS